MKMQSAVVKPLFICFLIFPIHYTDGKPVEEENDDADTAVSGMRVVEMEPAIDLPRQVFADLLHKGQFFQDIFSEQPTPDKIQFGHVCENPREWEQRFEQKDLKNNRHQGKVRWGNDNGAYGEHYWDLNHAAGTSDDESKDEFWEPMEGQGLKLFNVHITFNRHKSLPIGKGSMQWNSGMAFELGMSDSRSIYSRIDLLGPENRSLVSILYQSILPKIDSKSVRIECD